MIATPPAEMEAALPSHGRRHDAAAAAMQNAKEHEPEHPRTEEHIRSDPKDWPAQEQAPSRQHAADHGTHHRAREAPHEACALAGGAKATVTTVTTAWTAGEQTTHEQPALARTAKLDAGRVPAAAADTISSTPAHVKQEEWAQKAAGDADNDPGACGAASVALSTSQAGGLAVGGRTRPAPRRVEEASKTGVDGAQGSVGAASQTGVVDTQGSVGAASETGVGAPGSMGGGVQVESGGGRSEAAASGEDNGTEEDGSKRRQGERVGRPHRWHGQSMGCEDRVRAYGVGVKEPGVRASEAEVRVRDPGVGVSASTSGGIEAVGGLVGELRSAKARIRSLLSGAFGRGDESAGWVRSHRGDGKGAAGEVTESPRRDPATPAACAPGNALQAHRLGSRDEIGMRRGHSLGVAADARNVVTVTGTEGAGASGVDRVTDAVTGVEGRAAAARGTGSATVEVARGINPVQETARQTTGSGSEAVRRETHDHSPGRRKTGACRESKNDVERAPGAVAQQAPAAADGGDAAQGALAGGHRSGADACAQPKEGRERQAGAAASSATPWPSATPGRPRAQTRRQGSARGSLANSGESEGAFAGNPPPKVPETLAKGEPREMSAKPEAKEKSAKSQPRAKSKPRETLTPRAREMMAKSRSRYDVGSGGAPRAGAGLSKVQRDVIKQVSLLAAKHQWQMLVDYLAESAARVARQIEAEVPQVAAGVYGNLAVALQAHGPRCRALDLCRCVTSRI